MVANPLPSCVGGAFALADRRGIALVAIHRPAEHLAVCLLRVELECGSEEKHGHIFRFSISSFFLSSLTCPSDHNL